MTKPRLAASGLVLAVLAAASAQAQVTIDVAKISCDQFTAYRITDPHNIAIWLNGYHNGKRDNTVIDTQGLTENYNKLRDYCITNPKVLVMQAVETLLGARK